MSRILLTGATGYFGSHLVHALLEHGHEIAILKRTASNLKRIEDVLDSLSMFDLNKDSLDEIFSQFHNIDVVMHVATCYGRNDEAPFEVFKANTFFPMELLDVALQHNVSVFINTDSYFSTGKVRYEYLPSYSLSKKQFAEWGRLCSYDGSIQFINIRLEHLYGPEDSSSKFTSWIVQQCLNNVDVIPLTKGEQIRDFIYVDDAADAYVWLLDSLDHFNKGSSDISLGSGVAVSIKSFVKKVYELSSSTSELRFGDLEYRENEIMYSCADSKKLREVGWEPMTSMEDGIKNIIKERCRDLCV